MSSIFLEILNMSIIAIYVILFILVLRFLLKKAPKSVSYILWLVVAMRLIIPFNFESSLSLLPANTNSRPIHQEIIYDQTPEINSGVDLVDSFVNEKLPVANLEASANPLQIYTEIASYVWLMGILVLLIYSLVSIWILKRNLKNSRLIDQNIYEANNLKTPFVLGLINPKIYLPAGINDEDKEYVILHEEIHISRKDHIIKIIAFMILTIHWFNPFVWLAYILMSKDMELSCDEKVLKDINKDVKVSYANSLYSFATGRHIVNGSPLAFAEGSVKGRIKNVLSYKKPAFWVLISSILVVTIVGLGLLTNPITKKAEVGTVEKLWEGRTNYIGDNSAVANLVRLLSVPDDLQYEYIQLYTDERPYGVEIVYKVSKEEFEDLDEEFDSVFGKNALILLALIENADEVKFGILEDEEGSSLSFKYYNFEKEWADKTVGGNIKDYSQSLEKLEELTKGNYTKFNSINESNLDIRDE